MWPKLTEGIKDLKKALFGPVFFEQGQAKLKKAPRQASNPVG